MKRGWKVLLIIVGVVAGLLLLVRFIGSPVTKLIVEKNSEKWIGRQVSIGSLSISALTGNVQIKDLHITDEADTATFVRWDDLSVRISLPRLMTKHVYLHHIHLTDFDVNVWSDRERFNFSDLPQRFLSDSTEQDTAASAWRISLNDIRLRNGNIFYKDKTRSQDWNLEHLRLDIPGLSFGTGQTDAGLRFDLPEGAGAVVLRGAYNMQSNMYSLIADLKDIDMHLLLPVIQEHYQVGGIDGWLKAHIVAHGSLDDVMGVKVQGNISVEDVELRDANKKTCAEAERITVAINNIVPKTMTLNLDSLTVDSLQLTVTRDETGNTISKILASPADTTTSESSSEASSDSPDMRLNVGRFAIRNSSVNYIDKTLGQKFSYRLSALRASAENLSTDGQNHILLNAALPNGGSMMINWRGSLDYEKKDARIVAMLRNVQLQDLSPWVEYMFAYPVKKGTLSLTSDNTLHAGMIDGMQKIEIYDLKLGRKQSRSDAEFKSLPLKSALALISDMNGKILIEVPVEGDLNEPKFSLDKVVGRAIGNTLLKATAAPFVAMAQAQNIPAGDLNQMAVDLLQPDLSLEQYKKLDLFAQMMREQEELSLNMTQQFNLRNAIEQQALFNLKAEYYKQQNPDAIGELTLLDISKIQKISNADAQFRQFADGMLPQKGTLTARAVEYYTQETLQEQVLQAAEKRNRILLHYLSKQQGIKEKRLNIVTDETENLETYKGQNRYEVIAEVRNAE